MGYCAMSIESIFLFSMSKWTEYDGSIFSFFFFVVVTSETSTLNTFKFVS